MTQTGKAALLSFCIFPGAGHIYLKKYLSASLFIGTAGISLFFIIAETLAIVRQVSEKILNEGAELGYATIAEQITRHDLSDWQSIDVASSLLVIIWLVAIVDTYRIGQKQKAKNNDNH